MNVIGIDIGSYSIKIAELATTSKGFSLVRTQEFPLSQDPNKDVRLEIVEILRNLVNAYDPNNTRFVMALPQDEVSVRQRQFPFRERHKIQKSLAFELEDDIPFSQEDAIFDAKIARFTGQIAEVLAIAAPKDNIQRALNLGHDGAVEPDILSVEGLALANLFENWAAAPREDALIENPIPEPAAAEVVLHIGHESTVVLILKDGYLVDIRHIDWGGRMLGEAVSKKFGIHYVEALKEVRKKSVILLTPEGATKDQAAFSQTLCEALDDLVHDLNLLLVDVKGTFNLKYTHMALLGGVGQIKNLGAYLTQKLEIATNRIRRLPFYPGLDFENNPNNETVSALAVGLAIEGVKRPKNPAITLLRGDFARQSQTLKLFWEKWSYALKVAAAAFVVLVVYGIVRDTLALTAAELADQELRDKAKTVANLSGSRANPVAVGRYISQQKSLAQSRKVLGELQQINSALEIVKKISEATPGKRAVEINVFRLFVNNETVLMEGEVSQTAALTSLQNALKSVARDGNLQPVPTQFRGTSGWTPFGFRFRVDRGRGA